MRTWYVNQSQALARNAGYRWEKKLSNEQGRVRLEMITLALWASWCRQESTAVTEPRSYYF